MALTQTQVSQLYVSIFNRASEGEGNTFWQTAATKADAANSMLDTKDAKEYFGTALDDSQAFIETIYKNTLNKTLADDAAGIKYWVDALESGMSRGEVVAAMIDAIETYKDSTDPKTKAAYDQFNNRVEVSNYMAKEVEKTPADYKTSTQFAPLGELVVTDNSATVETAKKEIYEAANPGLTQALKVGQDNLKGTNGDDTFLSYVSQNDNGQQVNTLGSGDIINGGAGTDSLVAEVTEASFVGGSTMAIAPNTKSVENIILTAVNSGLATAPANSQVVVDAKNMDGVKNIASDHSDADLLIKNMIGEKKGVYGGTADQTVTMAYSGNTDSDWSESNMTVLYDQDYLTRSAEKSGAELEIRIANIYQVAKKGEPTLSFEKITINLADGAKINGKSSIEVDIASAQTLKGDAAYNKIVELMNAKFAENGWANVSAKTIAARDAYFSDDVDSYTAGQLAGQYLPILVTNTGAEEFAKASFVSNSAVQDGNRLETSIVDPTLESDTPVSINVNLEKVGNAADGGALIIGSMNKDEFKNKFNVAQKLTTTDTLAGFDEFNVHVAGDKSKNSSLSKLLSTDNTLRKVTIDSVGTGNANLTIGNSNTLAAGTFNSSANNAAAFKDVQIMDASAFKGDLELNAGFTNEIVAKYLANKTDTTVYGLDNAATELASFSYKGGVGNDTLNLAFDLVGTVASNFKDAAGTDELNVFKMKIEGGAGNDEIIVDADADAAVTLGLSSATNITIDGGAGNDTIDILNGNTWSYNVAFSGAHFGHDKIKGFNIGAVTLTDEAQTLDLTGFSAHKDEVIVVTVGNVQTTFKATAGMTDAQIAAQVLTMLETPAGPAVPTATQKFDASSTVALAVLTLQKANANVNSVTVEIRSQVEGTGTYDKDTTPIHSETSITTQQGGLIEGALANGTLAPVGSDTLDFSAYNAKSLFVGSVDAVGAATVTTTGVNADNLAAGATAFVAGDKFIWIEVSAHNSEVFNVYEATATAAIANTGNIDFLGANATATKGNAIGSFDLDGIVGLAGVVASQLLF